MGHPTNSNGVNGANGHTSTTTSHHAFNTIEETVEAFARGEFVIVLDDTSRENEGDLIIAAEDCTPSKMAFMIRYTSGYVCAPIIDERADALELPAMVLDNRDPLLCSYTVTCDALGNGMTTGISAKDRAHTLNTLASSKAGVGSFRRPGHVLPLRAKIGGVRERQGHTEAAIDLCRWAGKSEAAAICEMVVDGEPVPGKAELEGGRMMRRDDCLAFGKQWRIKVCTIEDMVAYGEKKYGKLDG